MTSTPTAEPAVQAPVHVVTGALEVVGRLVDGVADYDVSWMRAGDKRDALVQLGAAVARLESLRLRVLAAADVLEPVGERSGARDAAAWLAAETHLDRPHARRLARLAATLAGERPLVGAALAAGLIDVPRAEVVVRALEDLPEGLDAEVVRRAEEVLVEQAEHFEPRRLRVLGRRVLAHVAPEVAEAHEARLLAREDAHGRAVTSLRTFQRGDGTTDITARVADVVAQRLLTYLHAFTSPRRQQAEAEGRRDERPHDQRLGHALGAFLEAVDPDRLPLHGGGATTVVVTIDLHTPRDEAEGAPGTALLGDQPITAGQVRRLACTAGVLPAVLGGESQVLDLGRTRRLYSAPQRKALGIRHPVCAAEGCDIPAPWCEAHHAGAPWSRGGRTDLDDGTLLCSHHHHLAHDHRYHLTRHPDGSIRFRRRP